MTEIPINEAAVNEIVDYLKSGKLFSGIPDRKAIRAIPCRIVESLEPDELYRYRDPDAENAMIQFPMNWNDILGDACAEYHNTTRLSRPSDRSQFYERVDNYFSSSWPFADSRAKFLLGELYASDLSSMIQFLIYHRAACGIIPGHFEETLWRVIKLGGFPCGWYGGEDGMLAVYVPQLHAFPSIVNFHSQ